MSVKAVFHIRRARLKEGRLAPAFGVGTRLSWGVALVGECAANAFAGVHHVIGLLIAGGVATIVTEADTLEELGEFPGLGVSQGDVDLDGFQGRFFKTSVPVEGITRSIRILRGHKILLDEDLAALYGVVTGALIQAVKRNIARFPIDFMFQLTAAEWTALRSQKLRLCRNSLSDADWASRFG